MYLSYFYLWSTFNTHKKHIVSPTTLQAGIESLGFPSLDPFLSKSTYVDYKRNQMAASMHVKNAKTYGMRKAQILDVRATATDKFMNLAVDVRFPEIVMEGYFKGEGRFNSIKLASKGYFNNTMSESP